MTHTHPLNVPHSGRSQALRARQRRLHFICRLLLLVN